jgi:hypothetical protein
LLPAYLSICIGAKLALTCIAMIATWNPPDHPKIKVNEHGKRFFLHDMESCQKHKQKEDCGLEKRFEESAANCLTFSHHL